MPYVGLVTRDRHGRGRGLTGNFKLDMELGSLEPEPQSAPAAQAPAQAAAGRRRRRARAVTVGLGAPPLSGASQPELQRWPPQSDPGTVTESESACALL